MTISPPAERLSVGGASSRAHVDDQLITARTNRIPREGAVGRSPHNAAFAIVLAAVTGTGEARATKIDRAPAMRADRRHGGESAAIEREEIYRIFPTVRQQPQRTTRLGELRVLAQREADAPVLERHPPSHERRTGREQDNRQ